MNQTQDEQIRSLLKRAMPPAGDLDPRRDLWPVMLRRLDEQPARWNWLDLALAGAALAGFIAFPEMIPWVLFHC